LDCKEDSIETLLDEIRNKPYVSPLLQERVKKTMELSKKHNSEITTSFFFKYILEWHQNINITISPSKKMAQFTIVFNMQMSGEEKMYESFAKNQLSKLFTHKQEHTQMLCSMDIDQNDRVIASFIKYIMNNIFLERGDDRVSWITVGILNGKRVEFVPPQTMCDIEYYRNANKRRSIIAGIFFIIPFLVFINSFSFSDGASAATWWSAAFLLLVSWPVWSWKRRNHIVQYLEVLRNAEIVYNVYDESIVSE
jgi:hypothetical protein